MEFTHNPIFVFGSNLRGNHGLGAARDAIMYWGAKMWQGVGLQGDSYALPTKDRYLKPLPLTVVQDNIRAFLEETAAKMPQTPFLVTRIGCGYAGFKDQQIAPLFQSAPDNCFFDPAWLPWGLKRWDLSPNDLIMARRNGQQSIF